MAEFKSLIDQRVLREIAAKGREIYNHLVKEEGLEKEFHGLYIVINVDTGEYVLGKTGVEAYDKADLKFPEARQWHAQIGIPTYA
ncbi:MAG: hypothetical protein AAB338_02885 [Patescibacteria group bacterium]